jgi:sporulation integral membrane protein YtvI
LDTTLINRAIRFVWVMILVLLSILFIYYAVPFLYPFLIGWIIALMLQPVIRFLQRRVKMPRWLTITVALLLLIGALGGLLTLIFFRIGKEIQRLADYINHNYTDWMNNVQGILRSEWLQNWLKPISQLFSNGNGQESVDIHSNSIGPNIVSFVANILENLGQTMINVLTALPNIAIGLLVAVIAAFFISKDWEKIRKWLGETMPKHSKHLSRSLRNDMQKALFGFVRAQLILISITTVLVIIGLLLLRAPYAIIIGLLIGLVDLMPYLGTGAVFIPWIIFVLLDGNYAFGIGLAILYAVIIIGRHLVEPKIYSSSFGMNPLVTLVCIFVGLKLLGFIGLIVGPIVFLVLLSLKRAGLFRDIHRYIMTGKFNE